MGMKIEPLARLERHAKRLGEIAAVLGKYGLADLFGGFDYPWLNKRLLSADGQVLSDLTTAARVRLALTELGTTFIKLGQMLSTRPDLVGAEMAGELAELQSNVPAEPVEIARAILLADLGQPVEVLFAEFEELPLAAASSRSPRTMSVALPNSASTYRPVSWMVGYSRLRSPGRIWPMQRSPAPA